MNKFSKKKVESNNLIWFLGEKAKNNQNYKMKKYWIN